MNIYKKFDDLFYIKDSYYSHEKLTSFFMIYFIKLIWKVILFYAILCEFHTVNPNKILSYYLKVHSTAWVYCLEFAIEWLSEVSATFG